ncbi:MAG: hypothetical protein MJZ16_13645 [Bacteroidales bacterium]|nr:hypothetical protein [Bacteroidales bacterium]
MKIVKILSTALLWGALLLGGSVFSNASAQEMTQQEYLTRYNLLVERLGQTGVGIETLINKWETAFPEDENMLVAKFSYYFEKSRSPKAIVLTQAKYLGNAPLLSLKDSLGVDQNYFQDYEFDDETFGIATSAIDKAISLYPLRIDLRFYKVSALFEYEKESPDMALSFLKGMADYNAQSKPKWEYPGYDSIGSEEFTSFMQEYCVVFYKIGSPAGWEAFKSLSEKMLQYFPKNPLFMTNIGSYYLAYKKDNKAALKQYNAVLKVKPDDYTAIKNCVLLARSSKDTKLEKKYLPMLIKYTPNENEKAQAQGRLLTLNSK